MRKGMTAAICACASVFCFNQSEATYWKLVQECIRRGDYYEIEVNLPKAIEESGGEITDEEVTDVVLKTNKRSTLLVGKLLKCPEVVGKLNPDSLFEIMKGQISDKNNGLAPAIGLAKDFVARRLRHDDLVNLVKDLITVGVPGSFSLFLSQTRLSYGKGDGRGDETGSLGLMDSFGDDEIENFVLLLIKRMKSMAKAYKNMPEEDIREFFSNKFELSSIFRLDRFKRVVTAYEKRTGSTEVSDALKLYASPRIKAGIDEYSKKHLGVIEELD